jgi:hypothetical protein
MSTFPFLKSGFAPKFSVANPDFKKGKAGCRWLLPGAAVARLLCPGLTAPYQGSGGQVQFLAWRRFFGRTRSLHSAPRARSVCKLEVSTAARVNFGVGWAAQMALVATREKEVA